jgi:putative ABC transport system substrate-binding protein
LLLALVFGTATPTSSFGNDAEKIPTIGELWGGSPSNAKPYRDAFRDGLRDLGYVDGKNIHIVSRYANGDNSLFPSLIEDLVAVRSNAILITPLALRAALHVTRTVPIVCPTMDAPVRNGFVASLAYPAGNVTGLTAQADETDPKRLELAMDVVPGLRRAALLYEATDPGWVAEAEALRIAARGAKINLRLFQIQNQVEIETVLRLIDQDRPQALIVWNSSRTIQHRETIMSFAAQRRIPVISEGRDLAQAGALVTYSPNFFEMYRRAAQYIDKLLKGASPRDLPVEQASQFELIVNLKTAKALGITIPESILLRADEVIR